LPHWRKVRLGKPRSGEAPEAAVMLPDIGSVDDIGAAVVVFVAIAVIALVAIPLLLFGIELIVLGLVIAAGIIGRTLFGRPWVIQAIPVDGDAQVLAWRVCGWRRSGHAIEEIAAALNAGHDPMPSEAEQIWATPTGRRP
jgi:hypothetical protein